MNCLKQGVLLLETVLDKGYGLLGVRRSSLCTLHFSLPRKPDYLRLDFSNLFQFFPYAFHLLLLPGLDEFYFFLGIVEFDVGVHIEGDGYIAVAHQVLQDLGAHPGQGHVGAVGVTAHVRGDLRQLVLVGAVVFLQDMLEILLPVQGHPGKAPVIIEKELPHPVDDGFHLWRPPLLEDRHKAPVHLIRHGQQPGPGLGFGGQDVVLPVGFLELLVHVDGPFFQVDVVHRQCAEFRNPQPGMEQDVDPFVVSFEVFVLPDEFQENPHIPFGKGLPTYAVVDQHILHLEIEGIPPEDFIIHGHLKGRPHYTPDAVDGTVPFPFRLHFDQPQFGIGHFHLPNGLLGKRVLLQSIDYELVVAQGIGFDAFFQHQVPLDQLQDGHGIRMGIGADHQFHFQAVFHFPEG